MNEFKQSKRLVETGPGPKKEAKIEILIGERFVDFIYSKEKTDIGWANEILNKSEEYDTELKKFWAQG